MPKSAKLARATFLGLCTTCVNAPSCTLPRRRSVPIRQCLEFLGENETIERETGAPMRVEGGALASNREPGLCSWCELEAVCTFPQAAGGVWSCEEYR